MKLSKMAMSADQAMQMLTDHDKAVKDLTEKIEWMYREQCKDKEKSTARVVGDERRSCLPIDGRPEEHES